MHPSKLVRYVALAAVLFPLAPARAVFPQLALKPVVLKQIHSPTTIAFAPDGSGRLFVCDQPGKIYIIQGGMMLPTPFLDISSTATNVADRKVISLGTGYSERGLLCVAFHPGYANSASPGYRKFYLNYIKTYVAGVDPAPNGPGTPANAVSVIGEFQVSAGDPNVAVPSSERRMLLYTQPQSNHNGGQLEFGPEVGPSGERYLYIGVGDGGSQMDNDLGHTGGNNTNPRPTNGLGNAQDKTRLFGKILRIDPLGTNGPGGQYGIPVSNPLVGVGGGVREEIYSYGMRNPWKFSFDKRPGGTNRLFCGDVGGDRTEEVDLIVSGGNYGWRYKEGLEFPLFSSGAPTNPMMLPPAEVAALIDPIAVYAHPGQTVGSPALPQLGLSVTGGFIYRGSAIPALQGKYVFGDYGTTGGASDGRMMGLEETSAGSGVFTLTQAIPFVNSTNPIVGQRILCLGEDESGEIYVGLKTNSGVLTLGSDGNPAGGIYKIISGVVTAALTPSKDNTIYSENTGNSNGQGFLYAGQTGSNANYSKRRSLLAFDVTGQLPAAASIQGAQLNLQVNLVSSANPSPTNMSLFRLTEDWGEGASDGSEPGGQGAPAETNDATWSDRFFNSNPARLWANAGGTYGPTASATTSVGFTLGTYSWSSAQLAADVQGWVNAPANNFGWILIGNEAFHVPSARRFDSGETPFGAPPTLQVSYIGTPELSRRETWLQQYFFVGKFVDDLADLDGDELVNLFEYAFGYSPNTATTAPGVPDAGLKVSTAYADPDTVVTITFRRDPRATDLTYTLEASDDLTNPNGWTGVVQSAAGGNPFGDDYVFEADAAGEAPIKVVTAQELLPGAGKRFFRLRVQRQP